MQKKGHKKEKRVERRKKGKIEKLGQKSQKSRKLRKIGFLKVLKKGIFFRFLGKKPGWEKKQLGAENPYFIFVKLVLLALVVNLEKIARDFEKRTLGPFLLPAMWAGELKIASTRKARAAIFSS